jgi:hypothetical protein
MFRTNMNMNIRVNYFAQYLLFLICFIWYGRVDSGLLQLQAVCLYTVFVRNLYPVLSREGGGGLVLISVLRTHRRYIRII